MRGSQLSSVRLKLRLRGSLGYPVSLVTLTVTAQRSLHKILMEKGQPTDIRRQWTDREAGLSCITGDTDSHSPAQLSQDSDGGGAAN